MATAASKKISQLTAATTVSSSDPLAIVQGGVTKKATRELVVDHLKSITVDGDYPTTASKIDLISDANNLLKAVIQSGYPEGSDGEGSITFATGIDPTMTISSGDNNTLALDADDNITIRAGAHITVSAIYIAVNGTAGTAIIHLPASTAAVGSAPLKINAGTVLATPESGAIESDGTHLYWTTSGGVRKQLDN